MAHRERMGRPRATIAVLTNLRKRLQTRVCYGWKPRRFLHAACRADRLPLHRQVHAVSIDDEREGRAQGEGRHGGRHLESARRAARSPHGDVQSEEARPRHHRIHRHRGPWTHRRGGAGRRRRLQERRCPGARGPRVPRSRGAASVRHRRSRARCAGDGRRADPRRPRRRRAPARAHGEGSQEEQVAGARQGKGSAPEVPGRARKRAAAAGARSCRRGPPPPARLSAALGETAAGRDQPR